MAKHNPFLERLTALLELSDKSQKDIAAELGYSKPNLISMFKAGTVKVPLAKVPALAKALHADPGHMMRLALEEYAPELLEALDATAGLATKAEKRLLAVHRQATKGRDVDLPDTFYDGYRALLRRHV